MRVFAYVMTFLLALCIVAPAALGGLRAGWVVVVLIAGGLLWIGVLRANAPGALRVVLIILVSVLSFVALVGTAVGIGNTMKVRFDRAVNEAPLTMGPPDSRLTVAVVYHPGGSTFPKSVVTELGKDLAAKGCRVTIMTAHPALELTQSEYDALVLCSPVYGGEIRPPLEDFVRRTAPFSIPVFAIITGGISGVEEANLRRLSELLARTDTRTVAAVKLLRKARPQTTAARLSSLTEDILQRLRNRSQ